MINFTSQQQEAISEIIELNQRAQQIQDQETRIIIMDLTHWCVQLFGQQQIQHTQLYPQLSQLEEKMNKQYQESQINIHALGQKIVDIQLFTQYNLREGEYRNIYELISKEINIDQNELKERVHKNLQAKSSSEEQFLTQLLQNNNYNKKILYSLAKILNISIFIYCAKTKSKIFMGDKNNKLITIYQMKNACSKLKQRPKQQEQQKKNAKSLIEQNITQYKYKVAGWTRKNY